MSEGRKVQMAAMRLKGAALSWWDTVPAGERPTTYVDFVAALKKSFQFVDTELDARQKLASLKQGAKQSVQDFAVDFRQLQSLLPNELDATRRFAFLAGLRQPLMMAVYALPPSQQPATLAATIETAARIEGHRLWAASASAPAQAPASSSSSHGSAPMDLSAYAEEDADEDEAASLRAEVAQLRQELRLNAATWRGGSRAPAPRGREQGKLRYQHTAGVSDELIAERRARYECFACGSRDHIKRDCPKNPANQSGRVGRGGGGGEGGRGGWQSFSSSN